MIRIQKITPKENLNKITQAIKTAKWSKASEIDPNDYCEEDLKDFLSKESAIFCVAYLNDAFAGMASAHLLQKASGDLWLYIDEIDVCSDKQKKGVGTALMKFLFNKAKENECDETWLGTEIDNLPANALYKSLKPSEVENFVGYTYE